MAVRAKRGDDASVARDARPAGRRLARLALLGPAFVASIAYVDPGNVAANVTAGARHGFLLLWVLVLANLMAMLIQYQSAKLGIVTGRSLPELLGERMRRPARLAFWAQAEIVAAATDVAEVVGGAIALNLLFGVPLVAGGVVIGCAGMALLALQTRGQRRFEFAVMGLLAVIAVGFVAGSAAAPIDGAALAGGLVPRFDGAGSVVLAASMLGATVMPHAIYLHSSLTRDRHRADKSQRHRRALLAANRVDVVVALAIAGVVNVAMLVLAATSLAGALGTDTIAGAHAAIVGALGPAIGVAFAVGLLASGLASSSVGSYAGAVVMGGLLKLRVPLLLRRAITILPAIVVLALGVDPTWALVISQVVLSVGIPFALVPLIRLTGSREVMGESRDGAITRVAAAVVAAAVIVLNGVLLGVWAFGG
ncbi:Nramp family divalent metal transporter [Gryllotalpicola ginsengisoli]|uniref:Nramp family divalent metal transporter n=1 Tax=Gryllotalpicola ginsengisoli TaxID=444608 RepID=UPI0003B42F9D|nr:Nramp family divalent metal transporter [Gryllotalpicola ginsengisoli]